MNYPHIRAGIRRSLSLALVALGIGAPFAAGAHGDVVPQAVDVSALPPVEAGLTTNPYRGKAEAVKVGASAYNQNCARCHGLEGVSGGIAPDLRYLPLGDEGDEYFAQKVRNGVIRNGITYMPSFGELFSEEAIWAVRTWAESVHTDP